MDNPLIINLGDFCEIMKTVNTKEDEKIKRRNLRKYVKKYRFSEAQVQLMLTKGFSGKDGYVHPWKPDWKNGVVQA